MKLVRFLGLVFLSLTLFNGAALAQQADTVMENYRAYRAALQRGDLAAAEAPAAAAFDASQAQFGEGGRTSVLALNLARLRLTLGKYSEARDPATLALRVSQAQGAASGVDVVMAQIVLARIELATGVGQGSDHLRTALIAANGRADLDEDAYPGAIELGRAARNSGQYDIAKQAYEAAVGHAQGVAADPNLARGMARAAEGTVVILQAGRHHMAQSAMREAYALLTQAMRDIWPAAQQDGPGGELTTPQTAFARALAWRTLAGHYGGSSPDIDPDVQNQIGVVGCHYRIAREAIPPGRRFYPPSAVANDEEGIVVIRALFDETGHMVRTQVAASAPNEVFSPAAEALIGGVSLVRDPSSADNCVMPHQRFFQVSFRLRD